MMKRIYKRGLVCVLFLGLTCTLCAQQNEMPLLRDYYDTTLDRLDGTNGEFPKQLELSLDNAIQLGLKYSPQIRSQHASLRQSDANYDRVLSDYNTKYDLSGDASLSQTRDRLSSASVGGATGIDRSPSYDEQSAALSPSVSRRYRNGMRLSLSGDVEALRDGDPTLGDNRDKHEDFESSASVSLELPLNSRSRLEIQNDLRSTEISYERAENGLYLQEKNLIRSITDAYWRVRLNEEQLQIQKDQLQIAKDLYTQMKVKNEFGFASDFDLAQSEVNVAEQESSYVEVELSLANSYENFNILLGIPIGAKIKLTENPEPQPLPHDSETYVQLILEHNVELRSQRLALEEAENALTLARLGKQPDVAMNTSYTRTDEGSDAGSIGLSFSWPIGDGGLTDARIRAAEAALQQARINLWDIERQLVLDIYQDLRDVETQMQLIEISKMNVAQTQKNLETAKLQFNEGRIEYRNFQDTQFEEARARQRLIQAQVAYNAAVSTLKNKIHDDFPLWTATRIESGESRGYQSVMADSITELK